MALPVTDTFTNSDGTPLTTHSAAWSNIVGVFQINTNAVRSNSSGIDTAARRNDETFPNDQYAQITLVAVAAGIFIGPMVRGASGANTWYGHQCDNTGTQYLVRYLAGSYSELATETRTQAVNDVMRLEVSGTSITAKINGVTRFGGSITNSDIASGYAGICGFSSLGGTRGDNFEAGSLGNTGQAAITLGALTTAATGTLQIKGQAAITLGALTTAATGTVEIKGQAAITLGELTTSATGALPIAGQASITLGALTSNSVGTISISGAASITLGSLTAAGVGALSVAGQSVVTLDALSVSAAGTLSIAGQLAVTLDALTSTGAGALPIVGTASIPLGALVSSVTGALSIAGQLAVTLDALTLTATGELAAGGSIVGQVDVTLSSLTVTATAIIAISGNLVKTLDAVSILASGALAISGSANILLDEVTLITSGGNGQVGAIDVTDTWPRVPGEVIDQTAPVAYARAQGHTVTRTKARNPKRVRG